MQCVDLGGRRIIKKGGRRRGRHPRAIIDPTRFFQAEDGIRDVERSRGLGDVYKRQDMAVVRKQCAEMRPTITEERLKRY